MKFLLLLAIPSYSWACSLAPSQGTFVDFLLGPQCLVNTLGNSYLEGVLQFSAALAVTNQTAGGRFEPFFQSAPNTGTISVTNALPVVTGDGVGNAGQLNTISCSGMGTTNGQSFITIGPFTRTDGLEGYTIHKIILCPDETHVTLVDPWFPGDNITSFLPSCNPCSGLHYALEGYPGGARAYYYNPAPTNYYDNVFLLWTNYIRTTVGSWLTQARALADIFWEGPLLERGACGTDWGPGANVFCWPQRSVSLQGMFLRASEVPGMWPGLRQYRDLVLIPQFTFWEGAEFTNFMYDQRDMAYYLAAVASGCKGDPTGAQKAIWCALLDNINTNLFTVARHDHGTSETLWSMLQCQKRSYGANSCIDFLGTDRSHVTIAGTAVTLVNDVGAQTFVAFDCSTASGFFIAFFPGAGTPITSNAGLELYKCTFVDDHHLTLTTTYTGTLGANAGWMLASGNGQAPLAFTSQPYQMGLLGTACELSGNALDASGTFPLAKAAYHLCSDEITAWLIQYGFNPNTGGYWYYTSSNGLLCAKPIPVNSDTNLYCRGNDGLVPFNVDQSLTLVAESIRTFSLNYTRTRSTAVKTFVDTWITKSFTPTLSCSGDYIGDYNPLCVPAPRGPCVLACTGFYQDNNPAGFLDGSPKFAGQLNGWGGITTWFAATQGRDNRLPGGNTRQRGGNTRSLVQGPDFPRPKYLQP